MNKEATASRRNPVAVTSIATAAGAMLTVVLAIFNGSGGLLLLAALLFITAIVTGVLSLVQSQRARSRGARSGDQAMAAAGITLGAFGIVVIVVVIIIVILLLMAFFALLGCLFTFGLAC